MTKPELDKITKDLASMTLILTLGAAASAWWSGYNPFLWAVVTFVACILLFSWLLVVASRRATKTPAD